MPYVTTRDDTNLYVKDWGAGRPVILIHGWPLSADSWDPVALALADAGFRAIAYDRRGFGRSAQPWDGYDYDTLADDLAVVMEQTGATADVSLVGFSMGGGEVVRYMSRHQGKGVTSVGLISSVVPKLLQTADNPGGVPQAEFDKMERGMREDRPAFMRGFLKTFFGVGVLAHPVSDAVLDWAWRLCMQAGLKPTLACAEAFATTDFRADLPSVTVPTLIIHGTADATVPVDPTGRAAAKAIPNARLIEYQGAPHGLFATHEQQLIADLTGFLGACS
jgi:non-heme chloroperoxidase